MSNYTGLTPFKFLLLGLLFAAGAQATEETYPIKVPAEPQQEEAAGDTAVTAHASSNTPAPAPALKPSAPLRYEVKKGDTLWAIAGYYLQNPWQWPEIWYSNDQIKNPHLIYPGNILRLVVINGRPRLLLGDTPVADAGPKKLSPKIRSSALESAIPAIPMDAIRDFLKAPHLIAEDALDGTPYILDFTDNHIVGGSATTVYIKGLGAKQAGTLYNVVRKGDAYRDPDTGDLIGYEAVPVGIAEIKKMDQKIGFAVLSDTTREARIGDHLVPQDEQPYDAYFYPRAPEKDVRGRIISVFDGASQISQYQIVALNRGSEDGLAPGHVLSVMQAGRTARDPESWFGRMIQLPDTDAGTVMVFKTQAHFSYALVMSATRAIHAKDAVVNPR